ncbi:acyl-CoA thioesterase [Raineya orbicola]|uniref:Acyl-CoA thioester hydrolase, YbgC/YbaW family n=1 Tax=Raineya orbicola TaxID=2016530 RepID=A0A2N3IJS6_9BACT|nr:thioesterase family protein [Raineya orbicola]PKQ70521.1 acyl-CoA thioester hydrolase, YbgC/YbaW family [Raineya orbicola]
MYQSHTQIRVRYAETDQMKYVYYGNYAIYFEVARVECLRNLGLDYKSLESEHKIMMPVLEHYSRYLKPAFYDDLLTIRVSIPELPQSRIRFEYEILRENTLLHNGYTTLAFIHTENLRPVRCPDVLLNLLKPYFAV